MKYAMGLALALLTAGSLPAAEPLRFFDAHAHLGAPGDDADQEIAKLKRAGITSIALMSYQAADLQSVVSRYPGYAFPFISTNRQPAEGGGLTYGPGTADEMKKLVDAGAACGLGELATRTMPLTDPSDAKTLLHPDRVKIYELANARALPLTIHVDLSSPEVIAAFGRVASEHPRMQLILAHAGWTAGPDVVGKLLDEHPNISIDLSIRMDPAGGVNAGGAGGGADRRGGGPGETGAGPGAGPGAGGRQGGGGGQGAGGGPASMSVLLADGSFEPAWRTLIERHANRFLFATDASANGGRTDHATELVDAARKALAPLPRAAQESIAYGNMEAMLRGCRGGRQ